MKLHPKAAKFCPGCPGTALTMPKGPEMTAPFMPKQKDTKTITIIGKPEKESESTSLF